MVSLILRSAAIKPYVTLDGSLIREICHPNQHGEGRQSLAEAILPPGGSTLRHEHRISEEIYLILQGTARLTLGHETFILATGDGARIPPATPHCLANMGNEELHLLCCCVPPYSHADTYLLAQDAS